jgi:SAM-dependent methyltransferase
VAFDVAAELYDRFMGRYSTQLSPGLADLAHVREGQRVLDVGAGPGALTAELVARVGAYSVAAADPSEPFVAALRSRLPGVDAHVAPAEELPFGDGEFDAALAQLSVHFMADADTGLREMARVTRDGGVVAACVWDLAGGRSPISPFWSAVHELDPGAHDESGLAGVRAGHLAELFEAAGLQDVEQAELTASVDHASFEEWWEPFTLGVGPAGRYAQSLAAEELAALRERCRAHLPEPPFTLTAYAWAARGRAPATNS